jgi:hypothetical protein
VSIAFPVNVAEAKLVKQLRYQPCGFVSIAIVSISVFYKNPYNPNLPTTRVIRSFGMKVGFWRLKATAGI